MFRGSFSLFNLAFYTICLLNISFFISCVLCLFLDKKGEKMYTSPCLILGRIFVYITLCVYLFVLNGDFVLRGRILVLRGRKEFLPYCVKDLRESFNVITFISLR